MQIGCNTKVPTCCAIIPVINGATAPPEVPIDPMIESEEICISRGMRRWKMWIAAGDTGPRRKPENATATELPMIDGTNQIRSSRIKA